MRQARANRAPACGRTAIHRNGVHVAPPSCTRHVRNPRAGPVPAGWSRSCALVTCRVTQRQATAKTTTKRATTRQPQSAGSRTVPGRQPATEPERKGGRFYFNFTGFPFPLGPGLERRTVRYEVEKGTIWTFEQTQGLDVFSVYTPVRMTVVKLRSGGLWVHAPVAPTDECVRLLRELDAPVEYIILPTFAYEHKIFVGPFSRKFPKAKVYVTPGQWSFPLNLPVQFFGIFPSGTLRSDDDSVPWADEIQQKLFLPPSFGVGKYVRFSEAAFFHVRSRTLLLTDAVVFVPETAPEVVPRESVLELARDGFLARYVAGGRSRREVDALARPNQPAEDTPANRRRGWQRMALLVLYLGPFDLLSPEPSFRALANRLLVGPVLQTLVYDKVPGAVSAWIDDICRSWRFTRIIPAHFAAPIRAGPGDLRRAFDFAFRLARQQEQQQRQQQQRQQQLQQQQQRPSQRWGWRLPFGSTAADKGEFPEDDLKTLRDINNFLVKLGAVKLDVETR